MPKITIEFDNVAEAIAVLQTLPTKTTFRAGDNVNPPAPTPAAPAPAPAPAQPPAPPAPPAPAPAPAAPVAPVATPAAGAPTITQVTQACQAYAKAYGAPAAKAVLKQYNLASVSAAPVEQYQNLINSFAVVAA